MTTDYQPKQFWEQRLSDRFSLQSVGHIGFSEAYNQRLYQRKKRCIEACLAEVDLAGKAVLDIGCGTGFFVKWYLEQGAKVCGLDITEVSVDRLRQTYAGEFYTQDITEPAYSLQGSAFDLVNMWDVIYHIVEPQRFEQACKNIANSLKPGGLLLFTDWLGAEGDRLVAPHVQARCLSTYQNFLPQLGFELVQVYPLYGWLNQVHFKRFDNYLGGLYLWLDNRLEKISTENLSLGLWRYQPPA
ncbi:class I SAM-dependent methyltransferase [Almyronema epifaneia]|uniref:Class I SAM-dependent methyltransferase n=1 Tax=Almyronema epifaneia S1 TaxID=2991925 RepID=A0ABW6IC57_9CYAN